MKSEKNPCDPQTLHAILFANCSLILVIQKLADAGSHPKARLKTSSSNFFNFESQSLRSAPVAASACKPWMKQYLKDCVVQLNIWSIAPLAILVRT
jgi:hypothetical protein